MPRGNHIFIPYYLIIFQYANSESGNMILFLFITILNVANLSQKTDISKKKINYSLIMLLH